MAKGKFIVLEGIDGSGKTTQANLLFNFFSKNNIDAEFIHFPRTDNDSPFYGNMLKRFLKGDLGSLKEVDPWFVALLFAGDRKNSAKHINECLCHGKWVVADRYVHSNIAFQGAKVVTDEEKNEIANWILHTEFDVFKIPKPDKAIFINMPFSFCQKNVQNQRNGTDRYYLDGKSDIHEDDSSFQKEVYKMYNLMLCDKSFNLLDLDLSSYNIVPSPDEIQIMIQEKLGL